MWSISGHCINMADSIRLAHSRSIFISNSRILIISYMNWGMTKIRRILWWICWPVRLMTLRLCALDIWSQFRLVHKQWKMDLCHLCTGEQIIQTWAKSWNPLFKSWIQWFWVVLLTHCRANFGCFFCWIQDGGSLDIRT